MKNYYDLLEVTPKASTEIIEKAYKVLIKKYHPDLYNGEERIYAEKKTRELNEAYHILSNEFLREQYDLELEKEQNFSDSNKNYTRDNNENDYPISKNVVSISNSELLQDNTRVSYIDFENAIALFAKSIDIIKNNILDDYSNGISNASITVACSNYYDINGNLAKDWSKGEIIQVGDIVRVDKDNEGNSASSYKDGTPKLWRVTGRTFRKQGVPLIDLELQEIRQYFKVVFMNGDEVYATQLVDHGEKATEPSDPTVGTGYAFEGWFTADNQEFNFNTPINQDITLYAKIEPQLVTTTYNISPNTTLTMERLSSNKSDATIGTITTTDNIYYDDKIKFTINSSVSYDTIGININGKEIPVSGANPTTTETISSATLTIQTYIQKWTLISTQGVEFGYTSNPPGSLTTYVPVNNYNVGEELRIKGKAYFHLKNKFTNNIEQYPIEFGVDNASGWTQNSGYVAFEISTSLLSDMFNYVSFGIDYNYNEQGYPEGGVNVTTYREIEDDIITNSGIAWQFYALRKS